MTTFTRRPTRYLIIGALAALISTNLQFSAQATPTAIAIVMSSSFQISRLKSSESFTAFWVVIIEIWAEPNGVAPRELSKKQPKNLTEVRGSVAVGG